MTNPIERFPLSPEKVSARREVASRLRAAIIDAQRRRRTPRLEAVMTNDGIIIADFYGLGNGRQFSKFGMIHAQFDYDEMEQAITFVEGL